MLVLTSVSVMILLSGHLVSTAEKHGNRGIAVHTQKKNIARSMSLVTLLH